MRAVLDFRAELHATANSPASRSEKRARFASWRRELDALEAGLPATPQTIALEGPLRRHRMPRVELENMVLAFDMDAAGVMLAPPICDLRLYCRRSMGALSVLIAAILGDASRPTGCFALALGEAVLLTALLRDLPSAARAGRLALPRETLAEAGIVIASSAEALDHPALPAACEPVAAMAIDRFADASILLPEIGPMARPFFQAVLEAYKDVLDHLCRRGWADLTPPPPPSQLALAARVLRQRMRGPIV